MNSFSTPWIECFSPNPQARMRLFCFPYAGGSAAIFRLWARSLPADVEVCPIQMPGRWGRIQEAPYTQLGPLIEQLAAALAGYLEKPFALFGHSLGAILAFELARQLRRKSGGIPTLLGVSGCGAPQLPRLNNKQIHQLPEAEFLEEIRKLEGTPAEVLEHPEMRRLVLPPLRADLELVETYQYQVESPLSCPILALAGLSDREVPVQSVEAWKDQTQANFRLEKFPGGHFFLQSHSLQVLEILGSAIGG